ncbi:hypothetical protein ACWD0A_32280 [Streptomyces sp. NPDC002867]
MMARVVVESGDLVVRLSWWEKAAARRREVRVPVSALRFVYIEPDWWRALRGECGTGAWMPARLCVGIRHHPAGQDFVAVGTEGPVLCIELRRWAPFSRLAVSDPRPEETANMLRPLVPRDLLRPVQGTVRPGAVSPPEAGAPPSGQRAARIRLAGRRRHRSVDH